MSGVSAAGTDWTPFGPWYGQVNALAVGAGVPNRGDGGIVMSYAGTEGGVFGAEDSGSWELRSSGLPAGRVVCLLASVDVPGLVLAGTDGPGLFHSTNSGLGWSAGSGISGTITDLTANATGGYFAATPSGVFHSTDGGASWSPAGLGGFDIRALTCQTQNGWLFAAVAGMGMQRSTDDGASWTPATNGLGNTGIYTVIAHPDSADVLYTGGLGFGSDRDLYKTTNSGATWNPILSPAFPPFMFVTDLAFDAVDPTQVYTALYGDGVFKTTDAGGSWQPATSGIGDPEVLALAATPGQPGDILCATQRRAVYRSTNGGANWSERSIGISGLATLAIATDPSGSRIWTGNRTGIILSSNAGASWIYSDFEGDIGAQVNALALDLQAQNQLWAGTSNAFFKGDVLHSTTSGLEWSIAYSPTGGPVLDVVVDSNEPQFIHAAFARDIIPGGVARTTNRGLTWSEVSLGDVAVQCLAHDPDTPLRLLAGTDLGLQESLDHGQSFHAIAPGLNGVVINDVVFSTLVPNVVFVATGSLGVQRSTNGGTSFTPANGGMGNIEVRSLALRDGGNGSRIVFAATQTGCWRSTDEGVNWQLVNSGLLVTDAQDVAYLSQGLLLLGTEGAGVWQRAEVATGIEPTPAPPLATLALHGPWPNPIVTGAGASFELELANAGRTTVAVYDPAGRRVREILAASLVAGRHALAWDGRDDRGRSVPSGVYFLRAVIGAGQVTGRVAVIR
jgi:hypothetical protein